MLRCWWDQISSFFLLIDQNYNFSIDVIKPAMRNRDCFHGFFCICKPKVFFGLLHVFVNFIFGLSGSDNCCARSGGKETPINFLIYHDIQHFFKHNYTIYIKIEEHQRETFLVKFPSPFFSGAFCSWFLRPRRDARAVGPRALTGRAYNVATKLGA